MSQITFSFLILVHSLIVFPIHLVSIFYCLFVYDDTKFVCKQKGSLFEESDQAQAIRAFQAIDPTFNMDKFLTDARKYIVPELMEAYLKGDVETLKLWCSEAVS